MTVTVTVELGERSYDILIGDGLVASAGREIAARNPGARVAVHRKDILNAKHFAHHMGVDTPMTDVVLMVMDWMNDNGHIDEDQIAMVKYYEDKMDVTVGEEK